MKDYKKILEGVVNIINTTEKSDIGFANICTYIGENCPELKQSEDERIRKEIIAFIKRRDRSGCDYDYDKWIAWLKKQEPKSQRIISAEAKETLYDKFAWSKEDDENIMMIEDRFSDYLDYIREDSSLTKHRKNTIKEEVIGYVNWLKQLKQKMEEQQ